MPLLEEISNVQLRPLEERNTGGPPAMRTIRSSPPRVVNARCDLLSQIRNLGFRSRVVPAVSQEIKEVLRICNTMSKPANDTAPHLCDIVGIPELNEQIMRELECQRHIFAKNERPSLRILALRYGVSVDAIRKCNGLKETSTSLEGRPYIYIPPRVSDPDNVIEGRLAGSEPAVSRQVAIDMGT